MRAPKSCHRPVAEIRVHSITAASDGGFVLAIASVSIDAVVLYGVRLMRGRDGKPWVALPSYKRASGRWEHSAFIPRAADRAALLAALSAAYKGVAR
jgi:DNA-binding cell septation regulator SpoVG